MQSIREGGMSVICLSYSWMSASYRLQNNIVDPQYLWILYLKIYLCKCNYI